MHYPTLDAAISGLIAGDRFWHAGNIVSISDLSNNALVEVAQNPSVGAPTRVFSLTQPPVA